MAWRWIERLIAPPALQQRADHLSDEIAGLRMLVEAMRVEQDPGAAREQAGAAVEAAAHARELALLARRELADVRTEAGLALQHAVWASDEARTIAANVADLRDKAATIDGVVAAQERIELSVEASSRLQDELGILIDKISKGNDIEHADLRHADLALAERLETVIRSRTGGRPQ